MEVKTKCLRISRKQVVSLVLVNHLLWLNCLNLKNYLVLNLLLFGTEYYIRSELDGLVDHKSNLKNNDYLRKTLNRAINPVTIISNYSDLNIIKFVIIGKIIVWDRYSRKKASYIKKTIGWSMCDTEKYFYIAEDNYLPVSV